MDLSQCKLAVKALLVKINCLAENWESKTDANSQIVVSVTNHLQQLKVVERVDGENIALLKEFPHLRDLLKSKLSSKVSDLLFSLGKEIEYLEEELATSNNEVRTLEESFSVLPLTDDEMYQSDTSGPSLVELLDVLRQISCLLNTQVVGIRLSYSKLSTEMSEESAGVLTSAMVLQTRLRSLLNDSLVYLDVPANKS